MIDEGARVRLRVSRPWTSTGLMHALVLEGRCMSAAMHRQAGSGLKPSSLADVAQADAFAELQGCHALQMLAVCCSHAQYAWAAISSEAHLLIITCPTSEIAALQKRW